MSHIPEYVSEFTDEQLELVITWAPQYDQYEHMHCLFFQALDEKEERRLFQEVLERCF